MRRSLAVLAALVAAPAALAGGNNPAGLQDDQGAVAGDVRYVASKDGANTLLSALSTKDGSVLHSLRLTGAWGIPRIDRAAALSFDGRTLLLAPTRLGSPTSFKLVDTGVLRVRKTIALHGTFAFDALSPKAGLLYLVQYPGDDTSRYVVRAVNVATGKLLAGRVADTTQKSWIMQGLAVTRVSSADGRWAYTLYANPRGYPFVHALDTVRRTAHCVGIPWQGGDRQWAMRLNLRPDGRLGVFWQDTGTPYLAIDRTTWEIDHLN